MAALLVGGRGCHAIHQQTVDKANAVVQTHGCSFNQYIHGQDVYSTFGNKQGWFDENGVAFSRNRWGFSYQVGYVDDKGILLIGKYLPHKVGEIHPDGTIYKYTVLGTSKVGKIEGNLPLKQKGAAALISIFN